jgi:acyl-CoA synthetase (AMP-forming)/AMP-acid ligase II
MSGAMLVEPAAPQGRSPFAEIKMNTYKELLLWTEAGYGAKEAIIDVDRGTRWTFKQFNDAARSICAAYARAGVIKDDRIAWMSMAPGADVTALSIGARKMGAIPVVMNTRASPDRLAWMIDHIGVKALSYTNECADLLKRVLEIGIPSVEYFIAIDDPIDPNHETLSSIYRTYANASEPDVDISPDDTALVIYTSGSTGLPKPIMHSEEGYLLNNMNGIYMWNVVHGDRFLNIMPPHFAGWIGVTLAAIRAASSQICLRFVPDRVARAIIEEKCSHGIFSPTMIRIFWQAYEADPGAFEGNELRAGMLGGEAITPDVLKKLFTMFPKFQIMGSLGATECAIAHTGLGNPMVMEDDGKLVGRPLPGVFVELRDLDTGRVITEPNTPGEMYVGGKAVAKGVWGNPEATAENFPGGWWRSKDVLLRNPEGYLYFAGRADNVFKSGGIKVSCEDIEAVLKAHPLILDVIAVPVPDTKFGMVAHAFVRHQKTLSREDLNEWWREQNNAEMYARPRYWTLMGTEEFPMVTAAKVDRRGLRERALANLGTASV